MTLEGPDLPPTRELFSPAAATEEQLAYLQERDCDLVQGFYFSGPVPAEDLSELVRGDEPLPNFSLRG